MEPRETFDSPYPIVGMVHLPALPGAQGYDGPRSRIQDRAIEDARTLADGGVDAVLVENFGDAPFYPEEVPPHVVAEMTAITAAVGDAVDLPIGVNVLRNDAAAALSVAAATGVAFVRVNVHVGVAATDQGLLEGRAHETLRLRERIDASVAILADVHVKHATPLDDATVEERARETVDRGKADGLIVSGPGTGEGTDPATVERVAAAAADLERDVPLFVGSGVHPGTVRSHRAAGADGLIVGTALKSEGLTTNPVSLDAVRVLIEARDACIDD